MRKPKTYSINIRRDGIRIKDAAELIGEPASTLRWWEHELGFYIKRVSGQRFYSADDLQLLQKIKTMHRVKRFSLVQIAINLGIKEV